MKTIFAVLALAGAAFAQPTGPNDYVGAGVHWDQFASPQVGGMAVYAHKVTDNSNPTYSFTAIQFLSAQAHPFRVATIAETGVAQYIKTIGKFRVYGVAMAGITASAAPAGTPAATAGTNVGFAGSVGGYAAVPLGKGWSLGPYLLLTKPQDIDRQWAVGLLLGWGK